MESAGARIKKVRLEKGLSLEEVHKKTKIHLDILRAIEEDSFINLSPVYVKGFLKIYSKFLGVDSKDYIANSQESQNIVKVPDTLATPPSFLKKASLKLFSFRAIPLPIKKFFVVILVSIFLSIGLFNLGRIIASKWHLALPKATIPASAQPKTNKQKKVVPTKAEKAEVVVTAAKDQLPLKPQREEAISGIRLGIHAKEDCWIQLKTDGKVVFKNILRKGRTENWQAKDKIEISLNNAGGVDLEINGKLISSLGRKGQALKDILITQEGMTIGR